MSESGASEKADVQLPDMLGIHEAAEHLDVTMRTLRFYEDKGLIAPQRVGTTRIYGKREIGRMQLILRGKRLGFSIREIKEFLDLYDVDPEHVEQVRNLLGKVSDRIAELRRQKRAIEQTLTELRLIEQQSKDWLDGAKGTAQPKSQGNDD
ncbi:MerR family DNA-binding transcriptional regulator [Novosphingobium sp. PY1]|uniref:MerR family transcriptional regulator n=1 Tax=Novosphingobium sp. PY1 TaxID=1882221 RepID=UPI001AA59CFD|nr:MerR family DNA-binding transcriptional regulator [Novosphingobium sp. PY1]GFM27805.1 MerR family transcriptional regulator [Novosphingobium sp. PY1]